MLASNPYSAHVAARLLDFFDTVAPWHRRLWTVGIVLSFREVLEAADAATEGVISEAAFTKLRRSTFESAVKDPGVDRHHLSGLKQSLVTSDMHGRGGAYFALGHMTEMIERSYLPCWADALASDTPPSSELAARSIASSLLDRGFSSQYLHRWWSYRLRHDSSRRELPDILREAHDDLAQRPPSPFTVFVPFAAVPGAPWKKNPEWLNAPDAASWLEDQGFSTAVRHNGALLLEVSALDPWGAVAHAAEHVDRLQARVTLGTNKRLIEAGEAWIPGCTKRFTLRGRRRVHVGALERQSEVLSLGEPSPVDSALALLAPLQEQPPTSAVAGSWAAIEGVLIGPRESKHSRAAGRVASLVACSWPRAELTSLAHAHRASASDILATTLRQATTNRERSRLIADALKTGQRLQLSRSGDEAAQTRMIQLLESPRETLLRVRNYVAYTMLRVYRQRNLVLHGGRTEAECVALQASLRTAAPLIGAAFDRITHAWLQHEIHPLELAAKAQTRIWSLESSVARHVTELLE